MKKVLFWLYIASLVVFVLDWAVAGIKLLNGDYDIATGAYVGLVCLIVIGAYPLYRRFSYRCPHCDRTGLPEDRYCPYCGKERLQ